MGISLSVYLYFFTISGSEQISVLMNTYINTIFSGSYVSSYTLIVLSTVLD